MQVNLKHSRVATDNLMKLIEQDNTDIIFIPEPYLYQKRMAGISMSHRNYNSHEKKSRAAIIITNKKIDAVLIKQLTFIVRHLNPVFVLTVRSFLRDGPLNAQCACRGLER